MDEISGKIKWLADKPTEYPAESGKFNIGMKIGETFYNRHAEVDKLEKILKGLKVGYEVKLQVEENIINSIKVTNDKVEKSSGNAGFEEDIVKFETLLSDAHTKFKGLFSIKTEMLAIDLEKKYALFKAKVIVTHGAVVNEEDAIAVYEAHGDATDENVKGDFIKPHFIRMAETRSIVRALRWATNNATCSEEEK